MKNEKKNGNGSKKKNGEAALEVEKKPAAKAKAPKKEKAKKAKREKRQPGDFPELVYAIFTGRGRLAARWQTPKKGAYATYKLAK